MTYEYKKQSKPTFVYAGPAGTGKSTIAIEFMRENNLRFNEVLFLTFTGQASSKLCEKGLNAHTIHSTLMQMVEVPKINNGQPVYRNGRQVMVMVFRPVDFIDPSIKILYVDEFSTVDAILAQVILKHGIFVIAAGDEFQLPPVFGKSPFNDMIDYRLTEITRQAAGSPIIQMSLIFREGRDYNAYMNFGNIAQIKPTGMMKIEHLDNADVVLTNKNKTREAVNNAIRKYRGFSGSLPNVGETMVCRKNNKRLLLNGVPLVNGTRGRIVNPIRGSECNLTQELYAVDFMPEHITEKGLNDFFEKLDCDYGYLQQPCGQKEVNMYNKGNKLEYGYALTNYLAQGSQYNNVVYLDEWMGDREFMARTRYTAVTRAINSFVMYH